MSESWLHLFESRLQQLERTGSESGSALGDLFVLATEALETVATGVAVDVWLVRPEIVERVRDDGRIEPAEPGRQPQVVAAVTREFLLEDARTEGGEPSTLPTLYLPTRVAEELWCVLQVGFRTMLAPQQSFVDGSRAIGEIMAGQIGRHLLSQYETRLHQQALLVRLVTQLHQSGSITEAAAIIAQDGAAVLGNCRVAVLVNDGGHLRARAVTGVREPNLEAETVRAVSELAATDLFADFRSLSELSADSSAEAVSVLAKNGVRLLRVVKLRESAAAVVAPAEAALTIEILHDLPRPQEHAVAQLTAAAGPVLLKLCQQRRSFADRLIRSRRLRRGLVIAAAVVFLGVWPTTFEIEVPGQILSTDYRRIFAPEHGTIDEVMFRNEQAVPQHHVLLKMSNSDLQLELSRIEGEILATSAELDAVEARRLATRDPLLTGEQQKLVQRKLNLEQQRDLLKTQQESLVVTAPIAGTVFRQDPRQELLARPVQRGQLLLEIVRTDSQWQLVLLIPDHLLNYVPDREAAGMDSPEVRYVVRAAPNQHWTTRLSSVDNAIQVVDGQMVCRATALLTDLPAGGFRPGTSVTARIDCGRRPVGFVWFREIAEFWHQLRFAWF